MSRAPKQRPRAPGFDIGAAMFAVVLEDEAEEAAKEDSPAFPERRKMPDSIRMSERVRDVEVVRRTERGR